MTLDEIRERCTKDGGELIYSKLHEVVADRDQLIAWLDAALPYLRFYNDEMEGDEKVLNLLAQMGVKP